MENKRFTIFIPVLLAITLAMGILIGNLLKRNSLSPLAGMQFASTNKISTILDLVQSGYVDSVNISDIVSVNGNSMLNPTYEEVSLYVNDSGKNVFQTSNMEYVGIKGTTINKKKMALYYDAPAINSNLYGPIAMVDGVKIKNFDSFKSELSKYSVGDNVTFTTYVEGKEKDYLITMGKNPEYPEKAWMGIVFINKNQGVMAKFIGFFSSYKKPHIFYKPLYGAATFIYDLLWWLIIISFSVALINMLPMGIFDGGRFFYLTILKITKSEKVAKNSFRWLTYFLLALVVLIMAMWFEGIV